MDLFPAQRDGLQPAYRVAVFYFLYIELELGLDAVFQMPFERAAQGWFSIAQDMIADRDNDTDFMAEQIAFDVLEL